MNHQEAVQTMAAEKYLLDEFGPEERDAFEEHFFTCHECAEDIRVGTALMEQGKQIFLAEAESAADQRIAQPTAVRTPVVSPPKRDWFAWLRPAFAVPALAALLVVIAGQNLVQIPGLEQSIATLNAPAVLPTAYLASGSTRGDDHVVTAKAGQPFLLTIDIPGESNAAYTAELYDAAGQKKWPQPLAIPADAAKQGLPLRIPGGLDAGTYSLAIRQAGASESREIARYTFTLHLQ